MKFDSKVSVKAIQNVDEQAPELYGSRTMRVTLECPIGAPDRSEISRHV